MKSAWFVLISLFLCCFLQPMTAAAKTFYVNNSGSPPCSDTSNQDGSPAYPWCTISYGLTRFSGGDALYVLSGTYNETPTFTPPAGSPAAPTKLAVYPGDVVTIRGTGVNTGRVKIQRASYFTLDGFKITNFNQGLYVEGSDHILLDHLEIYGTGQDALAIHSYDDGINPPTFSSYVTVENCTIHDTRQWNYNGEGIYIGHGSGGPLDNSHDITVRNNLIYNTYDEGIELKPGTHDMTVDGNTLYNNNSGRTGQSSIEVDESTAGAQSWGSDPHHIVRGNTIYQVNGPGANAAIRAGTGVTIYNNVIYSVGSSNYGILVNNVASDSYTRAVYHNTIDVTSARAVVVSAGATDVRNNIGPTTVNNLATSGAYYVNQAGADYHLVAGSAPIDAGVDLTSIVPTDIDGLSRSSNAPPDLGAYEYAGTRPDAPTNLKAVVQ